MNDLQKELQELKAKVADLVHDDMSLRSLCSQTFAQQFYNVNK